MLQAAGKMKPSVCTVSRCSWFRGPLCTGKATGNMCLQSTLGARVQFGVQETLWMWFFSLTIHLSWGRGAVVSDWVASLFYVVLNGLWQTTDVLLLCKMQPQIIHWQSSNKEGNNCCKVTGRSLKCNLVLRKYLLLPNGRLWRHFPLKELAFIPELLISSSLIYQLDGSCRNPPGKKKKKKKMLLWGDLNLRNPSTFHLGHVSSNLRIASYHHHGCTLPKWLRMLH